MLHLQNELEERIRGTRTKQGTLSVHGRSCMWGTYKMSGGVQHVAHGQHTGHMMKWVTISIRGTSSVNHTHSIRGTLSVGSHAAYRHAQNVQNSQHTRDCKLRCCHHPSQAGAAAFSTVPQLGLDGPLPLLAVYKDVTPLRDGDARGWILEGGLPRT
jgi:hypothetical protein